MKPYLSVSHTRRIPVTALAFLLIAAAGCQSVGTAGAMEEEDPVFAAGEASAAALTRMDELLKRSDEGDIFERGSGAAVSTIGIFKPESLYLDDSEQWIPEMIKSAMNSNFRKFAAGYITVMNIADEDALYAEVVRSLSGSDDELSLTARVAARSLLTGKIIKRQGTTRYILDFTVTNTETHEALATYTGDHSDIELTEGIAVNKAAESLLKDLGIRLNDAGLQALYGTSNEADTALAKGLDAAGSGRNLQAMNYLFNAASFNTTALEASAPLAAVQRRNQSEQTGAGAIVLDFFERQELWQNRLKEYNAFYKAHPPFELYYTPPVPANMRGSGENRFYDLDFNIGLRWNQNQIDVMEKVLNEYILDGLYQNPADDINRWELEGLPEDSPLFSGPDNFMFDLIVNVENENGAVIESGPVVLYGSLYRINGKVYAECTQRFNASFNAIKYERDIITPQLYIRIAAINGVNTANAGESGFMRVAQTQGSELPGIQPGALPREYVASIAKDLEKARDRERKAAEEAEKRRKTAEREAERERKRLEKENNPLRMARLGTAVHGGPVIGGNGGTVNLNLVLGIGIVDLDVGVMFYPGINLDSLPADTGYYGNEPSDFMALGITGGFGFSHIGRFSLLSFGGGVIYTQAVDKDSSSSDSRVLFLIPYAQVKLDWRLTGALYLRLGYRSDIYKKEDFLLYFEGDDDETILDRKFAHNVLFGLAVYL
jgi:hypothetical protein